MLHIMKPSRITNNIWLGGIFENNIDGEIFIKDNNINCIITIMKEYPDFGKIFIDTYDHYHIKIDDDDEEDIFGYIEDFIEYLDEQINNGKNVYIHCRAGQSRSATFCIAYLMYKEKIYDTELIIEKIKKYRHIIEPNNTFLFSLKIFENWLKQNNNISLMSYRKEYIENMKRFIKSIKI